MSVAQMLACDNTACEREWVSECLLLSELQ